MNYRTLGKSGLRVSELCLGTMTFQVAINWLLNRAGVTCPIIGARTMAQFEDNGGGITWSLSEEQMMRLNAASELATPRYPYSFIHGFNESSS